MLIAAAQDTGGDAAARPWYERAEATFVTLVDTTHSISSRYNLVNVPSAVWIDEAGYVRRIDEGAYATTHNMGDFEFGRDDYAPMVADWVDKGDASNHLMSAEDVAHQIEAVGGDGAEAEPLFKLGVYFHEQGDAAKADLYWQRAQALRPQSWNYHRQDWSFTPEEAGANWAEKVKTLGDRPYYQPIDGLDH